MALPTSIKVTVSAAIIAVIGASAAYLNQPESAAAEQTTDNAYIQADFTVVASQVAGTVKHVLVEDNQLVQQGDVLATIADKQFVVAVDAASAQVASAAAAITSLNANLLQQDSLVQQAQATVMASKAALTLANVNLTRYRNLATDGSGTVQALQQAQANLNIEQANLNKDEAALATQQQQSNIIKAEIEQAKAQLAAAQASLANAKLQLSYTTIVAPITGTIGKKSVRVGGYVNAGNPLLMIVPLDEIYIAANFRETQLAKMAVGQPVTISVDAFPGQQLLGKVDSLSPASAISYSAVAPHNATGNFTKIVQRLPVKISIDANQLLATQLRVGMSVVPTVKVESQR
ncbi:HlyD family secretion protein [Ferrimonas lipolytica]|uniref:HlyD family secretion protein n=1 Tax=Ferrimonas lipolytica TaxID=2724191 RepID=A0A6H1UCW0_9GAMM|nr:HlyD family secretion protein [Ferrimonas lipolytica]QIZ76469.1 HlyD family secretion protein [Ferrimonas lipolytica]